ncbi:MAG TPA: hypothetical protein VGY77_12305 [Gemmataceae bacterium]|nr:hypothetical protein [Gemmataceae bacterium]
MESFVKLLAVIGGAALGFIGVGFVIRFFTKYLGTAQTPGRMVLIVRLLGSFAAGWLVWWMVTAPGGLGLFGGGGSLFGGRGSEEGTGKDPQTVQTAFTKSADHADAPAIGQTLQVVMLGGQRVIQGRFYLLEGESEALTLEEIKKFLLERRSQNPVIREIEIKIFQNSVASDHPAVKDLEQWAGNNQFTVRRPPPEDRDLP